jgi:hypothetical protein
MTKNCTKEMSLRLHRSCAAEASYLLNTSHLNDTAGDKVSMEFLIQHISKAH